MQGHSSDNTRRRSRALVPFSPPPVPAPMGLRGVGLDAPVPPEPSRNGVWGLTLKIGGGVAAICAIALLGANVLAPSAWVEDRAAAWLKAQTGLDLAVNGATRLSFLPAPHIEITDAVIAAPDGGPGAAQLTIPKLEIDLGFVDLAGGGTAIERIVLDRPALALHADGVQSEDEPLAARPMADVGRTARVLSIGELSIRDGTVLVHSVRRAKPRRFERINAELAVPALTAPMIGSGQFNWRDKAVDFDFKLASLADLTEQRPARLELAVDADTVTARYTGDLATAPHLGGQGTLEAETRSVRQFLAWLKGVSGAVPVTGAGELTSKVVWTGDEIALTDMRFVQENARGEGHADIALTGPRPRIEGAFILDDVNLGPLLALGSGTPGPAIQVAAPMPLSSPAGSAEPTDWFSTPAAPSTQIEQPVVPPPGPGAGADIPRLLKPGPGVSQPSLTISMPQAEIDHMLETDATMGPAEPFFDADVDLDIRKARLDGLKIGPSAVSLDVTDGTLNATLWHMAFYEGDGRGTLTVKITDPVPSFTGELRLQGVETRPLLRDAAGLDVLGGHGRLAVTLSGQGRDPGAIALSLNGNGAFAVADGTIDGIAPDAILRGLKTGAFDVGQDPAAKTPFSLLAGSFDINHGLAETRNLRLRSPAVSIDSDGVVNLPRQTLAFQVSPGQVAKEHGGGVAAVAEQLVPLRIEGPWASLRIGSEGGELIAGGGASSPGAGAPSLALGTSDQAPRGPLLTDRSVAGSAPGVRTVQPRALAPSFSVAPEDADGSPPLRMESLR